MGRSISVEKKSWRIVFASLVMPTHKGRKEQGLKRELSWAILKPVFRDTGKTSE